VKNRAQLPFLLIALTFLAGFLAACSSANRPNGADAPPGLEPTAAVEAVVARPTETPAPAPTAEPDECVACHIDQQRLIDTADPVVEVEDESSGVG
jgi:hypothetical protein